MKVFTLFPDENLLAQQLGELGQLEHRLFPDGESYIRILTPVQNEDVVIVCSLDQPNEKIIPLLFLSQTLKHYGAKSVTLITPYLCYMRQDKIFHEGEGFNARYCASLLSPHFDHIITLDPHLHRIRDLNEIYTTKTTVLHAQDLILDYIQKNIPQPFLIGPDQESEQWIKNIAQILNCPYTITKKTRYGDTHVEIEPFTIDLQNKTPVVIDDIASSGTTLLEVYKKLPLHDQKPISIIIHAVFAPDVYERLQLIYGEIITTNSIPHKSNQIDIASLFLKSLTPAANNKNKGSAKANEPSIRLE